MQCICTYIVDSVRESIYIVVYETLLEIETQGKITDPAPALPSNSNHSIA